ncbi:MAG: ATP-binding protein [Candidatus Bipolaricaulia bacterium]
MESLTVPGTLDSLKTIREYVTAAADEADLDKKAAYRLRLAVDEIATNVIVHGYNEAGREGMLDLNADIDENALTICLEDTGMSYDPRQNPTPDDLDEPLEQRPIGGLGVYLAIQGVDRFTYERIGDRNRNIFVVNRKATASEEGE